MVNIHSLALIQLHEGENLTKIFTNLGRSIDNCFPIFGAAIENYFEKKNKKIEFEIIVDELEEDLDKGGLKFGDDGSLDYQIFCSYLNLPTTKLYLNELLLSIAGLVYTIKADKHYEKKEFSQSLTYFVQAQKIIGALETSKAEIIDPNFALIKKYKSFHARSNSKKSKKSFADKEKLLFKFARMRKWSSRAQAIRTAFDRFDKEGGDRSMTKGWITERLKKLDGEGLWPEPINRRSKLQSISETQSALREAFALQKVWHNV